MLDKYLLLISSFTWRGTLARPAFALQSSVAVTALMSETLTRAENNNGGIATEQPVSKERNADVYDPSANALAKASGGTSGTCNHMTCYCAIA